MEHNHATFVVRRREARSVLRHPIQLQGGVGALAEAPDRAENQMRLLVAAQLGGAPVKIRSCSTSAACLT
jgi:hypothetical protein